MIKKTISVLLVCCIAIGCIPGVIFAEEAANGLELSCRSAILMEQSTGCVLYEHNADTPYAMASVTKVMTMLLIMEALDSGKIALEEMVVGSERAKSMGGSTIFLDAGEALSVHDMLKGIAVASANDACVAMAEHIAGSEEGFVAMMNNRAAELGMKNTVFKNTNGLDAEGHYSSARDIAIMSAALLKHKKIFDYTTIWMDSLRDGKFQLANTNKLIRFYKGANGLKTGSTDDALFCLSGTAKREGMQLIAVVMGAPSSPKRFADASKLLDYGFANYRVSQVTGAGETVGEAIVEKGIFESVPLLAVKDYTHLAKKGDGGKIEMELICNTPCKAPIQQGDVLGRIRILQDGKEIASVDAIAAHAVAKLTYLNILEITLKKWIGTIC